MPPNPLARVRAICLALPEAHEVEAWGEPTFRVRNKLFAMYASAESHHGEGRPAIWIKAAAGNQSLMLQFAPQRFFVPPYVGPSGWVGVWLDHVAQWAELEELLCDAYRLTAPKRVAARIDAPPPADAESPKAKRAAKKRASSARVTKSSPGKNAAKGGVKKSPAKKKTAKGGAKKLPTKTRPAKRGAKSPSTRKRRG